MKVDELAYTQAVLADCLGLAGGGRPAPFIETSGEAGGVAAEWRTLAERVWPHLTAQSDEEGDRCDLGRQTGPDLHDEFMALEAAGLGGPATPRVSLARWPGDAPFALFLSHDIDQIYDRELFRVLADVNHLRRILTQGETGNARLAARRVLRALFRPKRTLGDFETILAIEGRHGFRSTFFVLHDRYFARQGARFSFNDRAIREIGRRVLAAGGELGVHGGYYRFNDAALYRESLEAVETTFGVRPNGIRNHLLRFTYPNTWRAQAEAGFAYDATYGRPGVLGARSGLPFPFLTFDRPNQRVLDLLELPLTVMDTTLFRHLGLAGAAALESAWKAVREASTVGGLVTLLWHNNFFNEPEYWDWQMVYEQLLERLASLKPWCATGAEINQWWRARARTEVTVAGEDADCWEIQLHPHDEIVGLTLNVAPADRWAPSVSGNVAGEWRRQSDRWQACFPRLQAGETVKLAVLPA
jgi:hypothetical protein